MKYGISISGPIHWAITMGKISGDIARQIQSALAVFRLDADLYDSESLHGPLKQAELIVKLGYWLAMGQLSEKELKKYLSKLPDVSDNAEEVVIEMEQAPPVPEP